MSEQERTTYKGDGGVVFIVDEPEWTFEAWPIDRGFAPTNWTKGGTISGGVFMGAAYTHCFRATSKHVSVFGVGYTEKEAYDDAIRRAQEQ